MLDRLLAGPSKVPESYTGSDLTCKDFSSMPEFLKWAAYNFIQFFLNITALETVFLQMGQVVRVLSHKNENFQEAYFVIILNFIWDNIDWLVNKMMKLASGTNKVQQSKYREKEERTNVFFWDQCKLELSEDTRWVSVCPTGDWEDLADDFSATIRGPYHSITRLLALLWR